jgi:ribosomal protein L37AE/L43A
MVFIPHRLDADSQATREKVMNHTPECRHCGEEYSVNRWKLGYKFCLPCGDDIARQTVRTVVPMHKSNYMMVTDMEDLKGINNKGGFYK